MLQQFKIGHFTDLEAATGCTVIVPPQPNIASASVRGSAPGTRELTLLAPEKKISGIHALVLTGGSAFGLNCAHGVMEELARQNIGYQTHYGVVPIVPAAVIFDKNLGRADAWPLQSEAIQAFRNAAYNNRAAGNIGAGTGATVGKWAGLQFAMKGGLGLAELRHGDLLVAALSVVNAVGDILNLDNNILAGACNSDGLFLAREKPELRWSEPQAGLAENTVLTVLMTNARLTKLQTYLLAEKAHYGIARRVEPSHTSYDGDTAFALASGEVDCLFDALMSITVKTVELSIINAVTAAGPLHGVKSVSSLHRESRI
jgi:L-aminopeptidase/D-esterase-like protein